MSNQSSLRQLRQQAGLSVRELALQIGTHHTNLSYWERTGKISNIDFLVPLSKALGVTIEEVLGVPAPRKNHIPGGKLGQAFEQASKLPRSKQEQVIALLDAFVTAHSSN